MTTRKIVILALAGLIGLLCLGVSGFVFWASATPAPAPLAVEALESSGTVEVREDGWIQFEPTSNPTDCGLILYPGGRVDARSYAPYANLLANNGILTVIVPMPLNLAFFSPGAAADVIDAYPEIETWVIAGHSLGGSMAANFSASNPDLVDGLVLLASYPGSGDDLSGADLSVATIYGTRDGLATIEDIQSSLELLPQDTLIVPIEGGNHAQFGSYGQQSGDLMATISPDQQLSQMTQATLAIFDELGCSTTP